MWLCHAKCKINKEEGLCNLQLGGRVLRLTRSGTRGYHSRICIQEKLDPTLTKKRVRIQMTKLCYLIFY